MRLEELPSFTGSAFHLPSPLSKSLVAQIKVRPILSCCSSECGIPANLENLISCTISQYRITIGLAGLNEKCKTSIFFTSSEDTFP